jgi:hypothetical protein
MSAAVLERLKVRLRLAAPRAVRKSFRVASALLGSRIATPAIPHAQVRGAALFGSREDLLDSLPPSGLVAELGTLRGAFAREILARTTPRELHLVDINTSLLDPAVRSDPRVVVHQGLTTQVIESFPADCFDWIYIDADHAYGAVRRDAETAAQRVAPGGYLVFNDFAHIDLELGRYGVFRAVSEFAVSSGWPVSHFALSPDGLFDIALRRPPNNETVVK